MSEIIALLAGVIELTLHRAFEKSESWSVKIVGAEDNVTYNQSKRRSETQILLVNLIRFELVCCLLKSHTFDTYDRGKAVYVAAFSQYTS